MMRYVWLFSDSKTMNSYYYDEITRKIYLLENKKGGKGLSAGVIAGFSIIIYAIVRKIERPISLDKDVLYWGSLGIGIALGVLLSVYAFRRAQRRIDALVKVYSCNTEEKQEMAKHTRKRFFTYIILILVMVFVCVVCRFLMLWIAPSIPVYAFFNSLMCMMTVLLIAAFVGNHPLKGWEIAGRILKGEI